MEAIQVTQTNYGWILTYGKGAGKPVEFTKEHAIKYYRTRREAEKRRAALSTTEAGE